MSSKASGSKRTPKQEARALRSQVARLDKKSYAVFTKINDLEKQKKDLGKERDKVTARIAHLLSPFKVRQVLKHAYRAEYVKVTEVVYTRLAPFFAVYGKRVKADGSPYGGGKVKEKVLDVEAWEISPEKVPKEIPAQRWAGK